MVYRRGAECKPRSEVESKGQARRPATLHRRILLFALTFPLCAATCDSLTALTIPNVTIVAAAVRPDSCRVTVAAHPVADSEIRIEVWLPAADAWNRKFLGTGNGGYSGAFSYAEMESALRKGYAVAGSDTGHSGGDLKFAVGHPAKIDDWGWRAVHVMTETAKLIVRAYYGSMAAPSYFAGCSTGGHQALSEAQRFPADYDGIVAGAPGNNRLRLNIGFLWSWLALHKEGEPLPTSKLRLIHDSAIAACDGLDGAKDGIIADPRACHFDPGALLCPGADSETCLTAPQVSAVRAIYEGARNPRTGERLFAGWARGSERGWGQYFAGQPEPARLDFWRYWVFDDPNWNPRTFDFDRDAAFADTQMAAVAANDPNLAAFRKRNGKLIMYNGTADPVVPPEEGIRYYESVQQAMGGAEATRSFFRHFLIPGMGHCGGTFDALSILDRWVTEGAAPDRIVPAGRN